MQCLSIILSLPQDCRWPATPEVSCPRAQCRLWIPVTINMYLMPFFQYSEQFVGTHWHWHISLVVRSMRGSVFKHTLHAQGTCSRVCIQERWVVHMRLTEAQNWLPCANHCNTVKLCDTLALVPCAGASYIFIQRHLVDIKLMEAVSGLKPHLRTGMVPARDQQSSSFIDAHCMLPSLSV